MRVVATAHSAPTLHEAAVVTALQRSVAAGGGALDPEQTAALARGVLRVKLGYNPNSSSVGSLVSVLFWSATAAAVLANLVAATLVARRTERPPQDPPADPQPTPAEAP